MPKSAPDLVPQPDAIHWYNKGCSAEESGKLHKALEFYRKATRYSPSFFEAYANLGNVLDRLGQREQALKAYVKALAIKPNHAVLLSNIGQTLAQMQRMEEAECYFEQALAVDPLSVHALMNLGNLRRRGRVYAAAIELFERALAVLPGSSEIALNLALALKEAGRFERAQELLEKVLNKEPDNVAVLCNLGNVYRMQGRLSQARECLERAITLDRDNPEAHWNLAHVLLLQGELARGWREYEWRGQLPGSDISKRQYKSPRWDGRALEGKTLFLYTEQGCGDAIQFVRYAKLIDKNGGRLILQCQASLKPLFVCMQVFDEIITLQDKPPRFDWHAPLMSLPCIFNTTLANVPAEVPYLSPDKIPSITFPNPEGKLKVGLVWAGNPDQVADKWRSMSYADIRALFDLPGVQFYSMQVGARAKELRDAGDDDRVIDLSAELTDYLQTARVIKELDLVISVCTSVAHLAGAMGKPVWVPLAKIPDWRWLMEGDTSPWYPTARLFRQAVMGEWSAVVAKLKKALSSYNRT